MAASRAPRELALWWRKVGRGWWSESNEPERLARSTVGLPTPGSARLRRDRSTTWATRRSRRVHAPGSRPDSPVAHSRIWGIDATSHVADPGRAYGRRPCRDRLGGLGVHDQQ